MADDKPNKDTANEKPARAEKVSPMEKLIASVFKDAHESIQSDILQGLQTLGAESPSDLEAIPAQFAQNVIINAFNKRARLIFANPSQYTDEVKVISKRAEAVGINLPVATRTQFMLLLREASGNKDYFDLLDAVK